MATFSGTPQNLLATFIIRHPGSEDLSATFDVGQDSEDLFAKFEAQATAELFAKFGVAHWEDLKAEFHVGQDSADLKAVVQIAHFEQLKATFIVSKANIPYAELKAHVWIGVNDETTMSQGIDDTTLQAIGVIT